MHSHAALGIDICGELAENAPTFENPRRRRHSRRAALPRRRPHPHPPVHRGRGGRQRRPSAGSSSTAAGRSTRSTSRSGRPRRRATATSALTARAGPVRWMVNGEEQDGNPADYHPERPGQDHDRVPARRRRRSPTRRPRCSPPSRTPPTCKKVRADAPRAAAWCHGRREDRLARAHEQTRRVGHLATRHRALGTALPASQLLGRRGAHRVGVGVVGKTEARRHRRAVAAARAAPSPARSSGLASIDTAAEQREQPQLGELVRTALTAARPRRAASSRAGRGLGVRERLDREHARARLQQVAPLRELREQHRAQLGEAAARHELVGEGVRVASRCRRAAGAPRAARRTGRTARAAPDARSS